jgi:hypothetical protein
MVACRLCCGKPAQQQRTAYPGCGVRQHMPNTTDDLLCVHPIISYHPPATHGSLHTTIQQGDTPTLPGNTTTARNKPGTCTPQHHRCTLWPHGGSCSAAPRGMQQAPRQGTPCCRPYSTAPGQQLGRHCRKPHQMTRCSTARKAARRVRRRPRYADRSTSHHAQQRARLLRKPRHAERHSARLCAAAAHIASVQPALYRRIAWRHAAETHGATRCNTLTVPQACSGQGAHSAPPATLLDSPPNCWPHRSGDSSHSPAVCCRAPRCMACIAMASVGCPTLLYTHRTVLRAARHQAARGGPRSTSMLCRDEQEARARLAPPRRTRGTSRMTPSMPHGAARPAASCGTSHATVGYRAYASRGERTAAHPTTPSPASCCPDVWGTHAQAPIRPGPHGWLLATFAYLPTQCAGSNRKRVSYSCRHIRMIVRKRGGCNQPRAAKGLAAKASGAVRDNPIPQANKPVGAHCTPPSYTRARFAPTANSCLPAM